ncbi:hypothetical protein PHISP_04663 [Aspergillus sp. HF37]|nr:hypothetical protein PHISP_04663 [Aspergillus sp. HF37]
MNSREGKRKPQTDSTSYSPPVTRKRKNQSLSEPALPASHDVQSSPEQPPSSRTPRKAKKKVRFSDPGPQVHGTVDGASTGLTPAMLRTSFEEPDSAYAEYMTRTPSRRPRRRSTPIPQTRRTCDPLYPLDDTPPQRIVQFTPLRQILDPRTRRRIQRTGLSDEINNIERERRESASQEKNVQALLSERDALRLEVEATRSSTGSDGDEISNISNTKMPWASQCGNGNGGAIMIDDSGIDGDAILVSDSPDIRGISGCHSPTPDDFSPQNGGNLSSDAPVQAHSPSKTQESEVLALSHDLEAARKEKKDLFNACRAHVSSFDDMEIGRSLRCSSPPPGFLNQIVPTLKTVLTRASDATQALESVRQEISNLGFSGDSVVGVVSELRSRFHSSRLELERLVPGETPDAGLEDGNTTLSALVRRVEQLVKSVDEERKRHDGSLGRETALRGQFNTLLMRYEIASKRIRNLEDTISSSAGKFLHMRRRMEELEQDENDQAIGIDRLKTALNKYHEEVKSLEAVVAQLEEENTDAEEARQKAESAVSAHEAHICELEETVEQNHIRACDLTAQVEFLERERQRAIENAEQKASKQIQRQEHELGSMNVRVSELSTALEAAESEADKLRRGNAGLEEQLQLEFNARNDLLDSWAADQARSFACMKETVQKDQRRAKARSANWKMKSDDIQSGSTSAGSEPTTPVSMTRFVDVEVGRGKNRRRVDSGIGILSEDMLDDDVQVELPSDPANL